MKRVVVSGFSPARPETPLCARGLVAPIRLLWVLLSRLWPNWRRAVRIVTPDTVVR